MNGRKHGVLLEFGDAPARIVVVAGRPPVLSRTGQQDRRDAGRATCIV